MFRADNSRTKDGKDMTDFAQDLDEAVGLDEPLEEPQIELGIGNIETFDAKGDKIQLTIKLNLPFTDLGNAKRFVFIHAQNVRYCKQTGLWYIWDDIRWVPDHKNAIMQYARLVVENIDKEADFIWDHNLNKRLSQKDDLIKWAKTSQS